LTDNEREMEVIITLPSDKESLILFIHSFISHFLANQDRREKVVSTSLTFMVSLLRGEN
jgi:hypothetical protein